MNKVFALITAFIVALGCFMGIFALNSCEVAHADDGTSVYAPSQEYIVSRIYGAQGSPNYLPGGTATTDNMVLKFAWLYDSTSDYVYFYFFNNESGYMGSSGRLECCDAGLAYNKPIVIYSFVRGSWQSHYFAYNVNMSWIGYENIKVDYNCSSAFDFFNIRKIFYTSGVDSNGSYNEIRYIDGNDNLFRLQFQVYVDTMTDNLYDFLYKDKTVFLTPVDQSTADYQAGYDNGYNYGYSLGNNEGRKLGYTLGYDTGYTAGNAIGYEDGVEAANSYTFFGLISAVLDAPLQVFRGLLDFDVLGMNMSGFALSLFSVAMVIAIIRFIMAK